MSIDLAPGSMSVVPVKMIVSWCVALGPSRACMVVWTGGRSWQVSEVLTKNHPIADTQPSESTLVELSNGSLLVNIRDSLNIVEDKSHPERCGCRLLARSDDGVRVMPL